MKRWRDIGTEMFEPVVDARTEEKMFLGLLEPREAPADYAGVVAVLRAARAVVAPESDPVLRERVVASMVSIISSDLRSEVSVAVPPPTLRAGSRRGPVPFLPRLRLVGVMVVGFLVASMGLAFAGALPGGAQGVASSLLAHVGIHVPKEHGGGGPHGAPPGGTVPAKGSTTQSGGTHSPGTSNGSGTWPGRHRRHDRRSDHRHWDGHGTDERNHRTDHHSGRDRRGGSHRSGADGHHRHDRLGSDAGHGSGDHRGDSTRRRSHHHHGGSGVGGNAVAGH